MNAALDVLNLADAGFPTGAHGHSGGLEYAIQNGWVTDKATFAAWCRGALVGSFLSIDLRAAIKAWYGHDVNDELASFRTSRLQREASAQVGRSFLRSVAQCYPAIADQLPLAAGPDDVQYPVAWGRVFALLHLPVEAMAETLLFGTVRQWTQVVIRIVPLGQSDAFSAQTEVLAQAKLPTDWPRQAELPLQAWAPGLDLACLGQGNLARKYFRS